MIHTMSKNLLLFGAGRIGRSFIAQIFHNAGYRLIFVDVDKKLVELLNRRKSYQIVIKANEDKKIQINNFEVLHISDRAKIQKILADTDLIAVSVGQSGLSSVARLVGEGLIERKSLNIQDPVDIILAENLRNAASYFKVELEKHLPEGFPLEEKVGLVETSIGKMVPLMKTEDLKENPLQVFAEPYNTLILDKKGFKNAVPDVKDLAPKENMKAWVDRKLFVHNLGHACLAYLGFIKNPAWKYTWEALEDKELRYEVFQCMQESSNVIMDIYPGEFSKEQLTNHINDLLERFGNRSLGDTIFRVGCDLNRKLGPDDRLVPVIRHAHPKGLRYQKIMKAFVSGIYFDARDDEGKRYPGDEEFLQKFNRNVSRILLEHCNFKAEKHNDIFILALNLDDQVKEKLK